MGKQWKQCQTLFGGLQNHCRWWLQSWNQKMLTPWKESYDQSRQHIKKQRHYFAHKCPSSQGYSFSSGHVWMWELDCEESWGLKIWCFWTVVLEKTLESPLVSLSKLWELVMDREAWQNWGCRVGHDWATELNWTELIWDIKVSGGQKYNFYSPDWWSRCITLWPSLKSPPSIPSPKSAQRAQTLELKLGILLPSSGRAEPHRPSQPRSAFHILGELINCVCIEKP